LSCGTPRRFGDADGQPVSFHVELDREYVRSLSDRQVSTSMGVGVGSSSHGGRSAGVGVGVSFSSTQVYLLGGDAAAQGNVFRKQISWGDTEFTVPLTAGRVLHLTVQVQGGYQGWEAIGPVTIPDLANQHVAVTLFADKISATVEANAVSAPATK
jgi:hypothetical protein